MRGSMFVVEWVTISSLCFAALYFLAPPAPLLLTVLMAVALGTVGAYNRHRLRRGRQ